MSAPTDKQARRPVKTSEAEREYWNEYQRDYYHANRARIRERQRKYYLRTKGGQK